MPARPRRTSSNLVLQDSLRVIRCDRQFPSEALVRRTDKRQANLRNALSERKGCPVFLNGPFHKLIKLFLSTKSDAFRQLHDRSGLRLEGCLRNKNCGEHCNQNGSAQSFQDSSFVSQIKETGSNQSLKWMTTNDFCHRHLMVLTDGRKYPTAVFELFIPALIYESESLQINLET